MVNDSFTGSKLGRHDDNSDVNNSMPGGRKEMAALPRFSREIMARIKAGSNWNDGES
jgi:hypothetical protein